MVPVHIYRQHYKLFCFIHGVQWSKVHLFGQFKNFIYMFLWNCFLCFSFFFATKEWKMAFFSFFSFGFVCCVCDRRFYFINPFKITDNDIQRRRLNDFIFCRVFFLLHIHINEYVKFTIFYFFLLQCTYTH